MFHKFVIFLDLRSLFWPRLEPAHGNSVYPTLRYLPVKCRADYFRKCHDFASHGPLTLPPFHMAAKQKSNGKANSKLAFLSAEAFLEICNVLIATLRRGNRTILTLAIATNAAFSLEMCLKRLLLL